MNAEEARCEAVATLVKLLAMVPVLALELRNERGRAPDQRRMSTALVHTIYAFGGNQVDVDAALSQGREHLRRWSEQQSG